MMYFSTFFKQAAFAMISPTSKSHFFYWPVTAKPSVLWRCWLGGRRGIRPLKILSGGMLAWLYVWEMCQILLNS